MLYLRHEYPEIVKLITIGKSAEGRPLKLVKISFMKPNNNVVKQAIWIDGGKYA